MMLTFDWDDVGISHPRVQKALNRLIEEFGPWNVYVRLSSSNEGLHVIIAEKKYDDSIGKALLIPISLEPEQSQQWRTKFAEEPWLLECKGRLESDRPPRSSGSGRRTTIWTEEWRLLWTMGCCDTCPSRRCRSSGIGG